MRHTASRMQYSGKLLLDLAPGMGGWEKAPTPKDGDNPPTSARAASSEDCQHAPEQRQVSRQHKLAIAKDLLMENVWPEKLNILIFHSLSPN